MCGINRGTRVVRSELSSSGKFPVYQNSLKPLGYYGKSNCPANTAFVISAGAAGDIGFSEEPIWAADDCLCINCPASLISKFVFYYLQNNKSFFNSRVRRASVPRLSRKELELFEIPLPPFAEQERIAGILDKFGALVNDLTKGLPAEIRARQEHMSTTATSCWLSSARFDAAPRQNGKKSGSTRIITNPMIICSGSPTLI